jgi:antitoxin FitA
MLSKFQIAANSEPMPVNLSIKNAPDDLVQRLRQRAERHHRSLQGELLAIIEEAVRAERSLSPRELLAEVRRLGAPTPGDSAGMVRADRDRRLRWWTPARGPKCFETRLRRSST